MRARTISLAGLAVFTGLDLFALPAAAKDSVNEKTECYEVHGATAWEIRKAMNEARRALHNQEYDAATEWHVRWTYETSRSRKLYRLASVETKTEIIVTLPKWVPPKEPSKRLVEKWTAYEEALKRHEQGHKEVALEAAAEIRRRVKEIEPRPTRKELADAVFDVASKVLVEYRKKDLQYDWRTNHGAGQGASFP